MIPAAAVLLAATMAAAPLHTAPEELARLTGRQLSTAEVMAGPLWSAFRAQLPSAAPSLTILHETMRSRADDKITPGSRGPAVASPPLHRGRSGRSGRRRQH